MNTEKTAALVKGIAKKLLQHKKFSATTGGTINPRYCYSVWLRHLVFTHQNGIVHPSGTVAELGPGDSLGIGLTALLTGYQRYYALDVYRYWDIERNLIIFDQLVQLLQNKTPIPHEAEFDRVTPTLDDYQFPSHILTDALLQQTLDPKRIQQIRKALQEIDNPASPKDIIQYFIPWNGQAVIEPERVDFIFSQAVLQYVDDLDSTYKDMNRWLKPGGAMSHSIDFSSHGITPSWNGHWTFSPAEWRLAHGNNKILLNRAPLSEYVKLNEKHGFVVINRKDDKKGSRFAQQHFHQGFKQLSQEDASTFVSVMISKKKR